MSAPASNAVALAAVQSRPAASPRPGIALDLGAFMLGSWLNLVAYLSAEPLLVVLVYWSAGVLTLRLTGMYRPFERAMFSRVFAMGWLMAGVAAIYANWLHDPFQLGSDAGGFYDLARGESSGLSLEDIAILTDGAGAVAMWRAVYDGFAALGLEKARYIGVLVNVTAVAFAGVLTVRMARIIYGPDAARMRRLTLMFSLCGLFWFFAAVHLRDAVVLLVVTAIGLAWVRYLSAPRVGALIVLVLSSIGLALALGLLRTEFAFVPVAMLLAAVGAAVFTRQRTRRGRLLSRAFIAIMFVLAYPLYTNLSEDALETLSHGSESYIEQATDQAGENSLGIKLIVNQPPSLRLPLGLAYLFVFPIPFWAGFQLESAGAFFKSCNVLFFYALTPLLLLALRRIWQHRTNQTSVNVFMVLLALGFSLAIAGTSLESRHLGAFLPPIFLLSLLPDLRQSRDRHAYRRALSAFLGLVIAVHALWAVLKLFT